MQNYGPLLRATRRFKGLTQQDMGDILGLDRTVITRMEKGDIALLFDRGIKWFQVTGAQKALEMLSMGVEVSVIIDSLSKIIGGFILWI